MQDIKIKDQSPHCSKHVLGDCASSEVYLEDCVKALKRFNDKHFDLAIVDPPYGINRDKKQNKNKGKWGFKEYHETDWDNEAPSKEYWHELFRVSKNQIVWGANHFISKIPYDSPCWIFWDKVGEGFDFADGELAWTSFKTAVRRFVYARGNDRGFAPKLKGIDRVGINIHPTQKPVFLYEWCLKKYANEGDLILDTHAGSMSSVIACLKGGFNITAFEIDKEYFEKGKKRVETFLSQGNLFMEKQQINFIDTCSNE